MSSVEIVHKEGKKPEYKHYVNFLGHYKNGKKEDQNSDSGFNSFSLTSSSNNSSSSINSDFNDPPKRGFKEYLEGYNSKKYSSVQPHFSKNQTNPTENKTVKTEVFIEINNSQNSVSNTSKLFENSVNSSNKRVSEVSKMFEKKSTTDIATKTVSSKVNQFKSQISNGSENDIQEEQRTISIVDLSKKFENNSIQKSNTIEKKIQLKKQPSISEKSKVFEEHQITSVTNSNKEVEIKKQIFNEVAQVFKQKNENNSNKMKLPLSPKPQINKIEIIPNKTDSSPSSQQNINVFQTATKISDTSNSIPAPPPPPPPSFPIHTPHITMSSSKVVNGDLSKKTSEPSTNIPQTVAFASDSINNLPPPPPPAPPLPPANSVPSLNRTSSFSKPKNGQKSIHVNGYSTLPRMQNGTKTDKVDGLTAPTLDKNDPRVKKLVYGALREMYGSYHDKANDYLATLPKNRVRKNNGLDSIIDSIKSQGGLDKLNGRVNPKAENE